MQKIFPTVPDLRCVRCAYDRAVTLTRVPRSSISAVRCHGSYTVYESDSFNDSEKRGGGRHGDGCVSIPVGSSTQEGRAERKVDELTERQSMHLLKKGKGRRPWPSSIDDERNCNVCVCVHRPPNPLLPGQRPCRQCCHDLPAV